MVKDINNITKWIFQGNPKRYNLERALNDEEYKGEIHWSVNQHKLEIREGHKGVIWICGPKSGIYAIFDIIKVPSEKPFKLEEFVWEREYWSDKSDNLAKKNIYRVRIKITKNLINNYIPKETIRGLSNAKGQERLSILRYHQMTNFPITDDQWKAIEKKVKEW
jgi:hypothetical protein